MRLTKGTLLKTGKAPFLLTNDYLYVNIKFHCKEDEMIQNNYSIVLFLQYSPYSFDLNVIAYTEAELYIKRPNEKRDWIYWIKTHLITKMKTDIPKEKFRNHFLPTKLIKRKGNTLTLQVISLNSQTKTEYEGRLIEIETKAELIPDLEKILEKLSKCVNRIRSVKGDEKITPEIREELLKATNIEFCKLLEVLKIGSLVFEEKKLETLISNLNDVKKFFQEEPPVDVPKKLINLIGEYEQQLKEINHFNGQK